MPIVDRTSPHTDPKNASWRSACHENLTGIPDGDQVVEDDSPIGDQIDADPTPDALAG